MSDLVYQNAVRAHHAGKLDEAARLYGEVLRANPRHFPALVSFGYLHFEAGHFVEAERILSEAVRLNRQSPEALFFRGSALERLGRAGEALACFDAALNLRPNFFDAQLSRAGALRSLGRGADALRLPDALRDRVPRSGRSGRSWARCRPAVTAGPTFRGEPDPSSRDGTKVRFPTAGGLSTIERQ